MIAVVPLRQVAIVTRTNFTATAAVRPNHCKIKTQLRKHHHPFNTGNNNFSSLYTYTFIYSAPRKTLHNTVVLTRQQHLHSLHATTPFYSRSFTSRFDGETQDHISTHCDISLSVKFLDNLTRVA